MPSETCIMNEIWDSVRQCRKEERKNAIFSVCASVGPIHSAISSARNVFHFLFSHSCLVCAFAANSLCVFWLVFFSFLCLKKNRPLVCCLVCVYFCCQYHFLFTFYFILHSLHKRNAVWLQGSLRYVCLQCIPALTTFYKLYTLNLAIK